MRSPAAHRALDRRILWMVAIVLAFGLVGAGRARASSAVAAPAQWSTVPTPNVPGAALSGLFGVSCAATWDCVAVGGAGASLQSGQPLALHWDGRAWTTMTGTSTPSGGALNAIDCPIRSGCVAVGRTDDYRASAEHWNGVRWQADPIITPGPEVDLMSISCPGARDCVAVGQALTLSGYAYVAAERWDGRWHLAMPSRADAVQLRSVSCPTARFCLAVGEGHSGPVAMRFDGRRWSAVPVNSSTGTLGFVSCHSASLCVADGFAEGPQLSPLVERWNGRTLQAITVPMPQNIDGPIACSRRGLSCTLVAGARTSAQPPYAVHFDGRSWSTTALVPVPREYEELTGISCPTPALCMVAGYGYDTDIPSVGYAASTLALMATGLSWSPAA